MKNKWDYLSRLKSAIEDLHKCAACYLRTQLVDETVRGKTVWVGDVEIFALTGHRKARRCYAWNHSEGRKDQVKWFVAVLGIPPVVSAETAVWVSIAKDGKEMK